MDKIALFGPNGKSGHQFLRLALDAGYNVHVLLSPKVSLRAIQEFAGHPRLSITTGNLTDEEQIEEVVQDAQYIVCMLNDTLPTKREYPAKTLLHFVQRLYSIIGHRQSKLKLFVFQSNSLAPCVKGGTTPLLSKLLKTAARNRCAATKDQSAVVKFIGRQHGILRRNKNEKKHYNEVEEDKMQQIHAEDDESDINQEDDISTTQQAPLPSTEPPTFDFLITRPTVLLQEGPPSKDLKASKSQPGPFPVRYADVASFTLGALRNERLHNTSPYVVADSF